MEKPDQTTTTATTSTTGSTTGSTTTIKANAEELALHRCPRCSLDTREEEELYNDEQHDDNKTNDKNDDEEKTGRRRGNRRRRSSAVQEIAVELVRKIRRSHSHSHGGKQEGF